MKYLPKEICEYLVSLGCISESGKFWCCSEFVSDSSQGSSIHGHDGVSIETSDIVKYTPAFSLEDILRRDNAEKIWPDIEGWKTWHLQTQKLLRTFQEHPDTWPEEVAKLIKP